MTKGLKYLLIAIVITLLAFLHAAGGVGFLIALPIWYALYKLIYTEAK